jgi:hypothetical protein
MWSVPGNLVQPAQLKSLFDSVQQFHGKLTQSLANAQAEAIGRMIEEIEGQVAILEKPDDSTASASPGWGQLLDKALSTALCGVPTREISIHLLRANAESLKVAYSFSQAAIAAMERAMPPKTPPLPPTAEKLIVS